MTNSSPNNTNLGQPCDIQCLQGNLRRSEPAMLSLLVDVASKKIYPNGVDIIFLTEPPCVTTTNKLSNVPGNVYNVFAEKAGRAALLTKGITSWHCPQYCTKDIIVCQTKLNNQLTFLVSMYLDQKVPNFPPEFIELIRKKGECDILIGTDSNAHSTVLNCPQTDK